MKEELHKVSRQEGIWVFKLGGSHMQRMIMDNKIMREEMKEEETDRVGVRGWVGLDNPKTD